jgi:hypothetical protein
VSTLAPITSASVILRTVERLTPAYSARARTKSGSPRNRSSIRARTLSARTRRVRMATNFGRLVSPDMGANRSEAAGPSVVLALGPHLDLESESYGNITFTHVLQGARPSDRAPR